MRQLWKCLKEDSNLRTSLCLEFSKLYALYNTSDANSEDFTTDFAQLVSGFTPRRLRYEHYIVLHMAFRNLVKRNDTPDDVVFATEGATSDWVQEMAAHPDVQEWLSMWYRSVADTHQLAISKHGYTWWYSRLYSSLMPNSSTGIASSVAEADWRVDCQGSGALSQQAFEYVVLDVVHMWCSTLEVRAIVDFLSTLYVTVCHDRQPTPSTGKSIKESPSHRSARSEKTSSRSSARSKLTSAKKKPSSVSVKSTSEETATVSSFHHSGSWSGRASDSETTGPRLSVSTMDSPVGRADETEDEDCSSATLLVPVKEEPEEEEAPALVGPNPTGGRKRRDYLSRKPPTNVRNRSPSPSRAPVLATESRLEKRKTRGGRRNNSLTETADDLFATFRKEFLEKAPEQAPSRITSGKPRPNPNSLAGRSLNLQRREQKVFHSRLGIEEPDLDVLDSNDTEVIKHLLRYTTHTQMRVMQSAKPLLRARSVSPNAGKEIRPVRKRLSDIVREHTVAINTFYGKPNHPGVSNAGSAIGVSPPGLPSLSRPLQVTKAGGASSAGPFQGHGRKGQGGVAAPMTNAALPPAPVTTTLNAKFSVPGAPKGFNGYWA
eukprot:TRINITY_DN65772_c0_g1_i1.p1 TRINITY_DN65772_c0_g1~~TRINITY_DN65772_c0_g1_i1.p1  ORF type:complete len:603 (+),score=16.52 TRINITY_DN65772_c0_g1_i1:67-1875(+)